MTTKKFRERIEKANKRGCYSWTAWRDVALYAITELEARDRDLLSKGAECRHYAERAEKAEAAIDHIITAYDLPGEHCELDDAIAAARKLLKEEKR